jgi:hypothetical protein
VTPRRRRLGRRARECIHLHGGRRGSCAPLPRRRLRRWPVALFNTRRHACATQVAITIEHGTDRFKVCVSDNGKRVDELILRRTGRTSRPSRDGRTRGAEFAISSEPGPGTNVTVPTPAAAAYSDEAGAPRDPPTPERTLDAWSRPALSQCRYKHAIKGAPA